MTLAKRPLGQTGIEVSCLGLGTVKFGRNQDVKYPTSFSLPEDRQIVALLDQASKLGINLLDTAPAYGSSEQRLGRLLRERDRWVISTKAGEEFNNGQSFFDFSARHIRHSIERSLRNIRTDYLDIVLIHSDGRDLHVIESTDCIATLQQLKQEGLIRAIGMSTKTVAGGIKAAELMDVVMVTYNPSAPADGEIIDHACKLNKGVLIKKALNSGHDCLEKYSSEHNLRYVFARHGVSSAIIGTINEAHLAANVAAAEKASGDTHNLIT